MSIEPVESIPSLRSLIEAGEGFRSGGIWRAELLSHYDFAGQVAIARFEATGSKVVADGEQVKENFAIYPIHGPTNIAAGGITISFADGRNSLFFPHNIGDKFGNDSKLKRR